MISIKMVNCIDNVNCFLSEDTKQNVLNLLFPQIYELLKPQVNKIHNIKCYEICAIAMMGIISNNNEMLNYAFNSKNSFYNQLEYGVTKDYLWFEGSFHYHFFVLKPILELLRIAKKYNYNIPKKYYDTTKMMLFNGYKSSFLDCSLPSQNDGWPNRKLIDYIDVFELGNTIFENEFTEVINLIKKCQNPSPTLHYLDAGFSILRNKYWNVFIKYKDNNYSHAHPDKLNIEIKQGNDFLTHDISTSGYGSKISSEYCKKSYSHNTIVIDGKDQFLDCSNIIHSYSENMINVTVENVYNKCNITRKIMINNNCIDDELSVENVENVKSRCIDYIFNCDAKLITNLKYTDLKTFEEYPYLYNIKKVITSEEEIILGWNLNKKHITSKINLKDKELYICNCPDNPNKHDRTTLILRSFENNVKNVTFNIEWNIL